MGLSIRSTNRAVQVKAPATNEDLFDLWDGDHSRHIIQPEWVLQWPHNYVDLDPSLSGVGGTYVLEAELNDDLESMSRSYSGFGIFRNAVAEFFMNASDKEVWDDADSYRGRAPFYNLVDFSDCQGIITTPAVRVLASDFRYAQQTMWGSQSVEKKFMERLEADCGMGYAEQWLLLRDHVYHAARVGGVLVFS